MIERKHFPPRECVVHPDLLIEVTNEYETSGFVYYDLADTRCCGKLLRH